MSAGGVPVITPVTGSIDIQAGRSGDVKVSASPSGSEKPTLASNGTCGALSKPVCAARGPTIMGASSTSRNRRSVTNGTAFPPSALSAATPGKLKFVSVTSRFVSFTSKPSLIFVSSKTSNKPSPSVSVAASERPVAGIVPRPASSVSLRPSLSESVSK